MGFEDVELQIVLETKFSFSLRVIGFMGFLY